MSKSSLRSSRSRISELGVLAYDLKHHAWVAPRKSIDDGRDEARAKRRRAPDPHFARGWVGKKLDVLDALPQFVEGSMAAIE